MEKSLCGCSLLGIFSGRANVVEGLRFLQSRPKKKAGTGKPAPAILIEQGELKVKQAHQVVDGRTVDGHIRIICRSNRVGEVVAAAG